MMLLPQKDMKISHRFVLAAVVALSFSLLCLKFFKSPPTETTKGLPENQPPPATTLSNAPLEEAVRPSVAAESSVSPTAEILALLASGNPLDQSKVYKELLPAFIRRDPRAAAAFAQSPEAARWHDDLMVTVAQVWTDMNVDDAENWATQLSNPTERSMVLGYVCFEEANIDPNRAVQVLDNSEVNSVRREIIVENLAQQWANQDLGPLYNQVDKLPPGDERESLFKSIALSQSQTNPRLAAQMIIDKMTPGPLQIDAVMYVLRPWARQDMAGAQEWVSQFPSGELRDKAMRVLAGNLYGAYQAN